MHTRQSWATGRWRASNRLIFDAAVRHAGFDFVGETAQLESGARYFAIEAGLAQAAFTVGNGNQFSLVGLQCVCQAMQQGGTYGRTRRTPDKGGRIGLGHGLVNGGIGRCLSSSHVRSRSRVVKG
ncbi:hypothetical protein D3C80_1470550 [compost metagenome]